MYPQIYEPALSAGQVSPPKQTHAFFPDFWQAAPVQIFVRRKECKTMFTKVSRFRRLLGLGAVPRLLLLSAVTSPMLIAVYTIAYAQIQTVPSWVGHLLLGNSTIAADSTLTAPEAQGLVQKFELSFAMANAQNPHNVHNHL